MEDMDMFGATQIQAGDDMFTSIATAIAVRKCRLVQKKEKLKLLIHSSKEVNEKIKLEKEENKRLIQEEREVTQRQATAVANLKRTQESRQSLETVLSELNAKLLFERAETKRQSDEYNSALQKSDEIWESYKKKYEEFPLAKELQALKLDKKKVDFEKRETLMLVAETKRQKKMKDEITDKLCYTKLVKLAELYFKYQNKTAERNSLLKQKKELEKLIEDTKSKRNALSFRDKSENIPKTTAPQVAKQTQIFRPTWQFNMSEIQINSPPPVDNSEPSSDRSLFDWSTLLESSNSLFSFIKRNNQRKEKSNTNDSAQTILNVNVPTMSFKEQTKSSIKQNETMMPRTVKNTSDEGVLKRKSKVQSNVRSESLLAHPHKKPNNQKVPLIKESLEISIQQKPVIEEKKFIRDITKKGTDKENIRKNSLSDLKKYVSQTHMNTKSSVSNLYQKENTVSHNLSNMLTLKKSDKNIEIKKNTPAEPYLPPSNPSVEDTNNTELEKNNQMVIEERDCLEGDLFANENNDKQPENNALSMDPNSPPDIIPVENNSQPLSQGMINSGKFLSQGSSEFNSPLELNENEKLIYQRLAAESPEFTYPKGTDMISTHRTGDEASKPLIRSKYFSGMQPFSPPTSLNTPPLDQDDCNLSIPYSTSTLEYVNSPPNATLGGYELGNISCPTETSLFGNASKKDDNNQGNNGFNFFGGASKSKSSIFSLF